MTKSSLIRTAAVSLIATASANAFALAPNDVWTGTGLASTAVTASDLVRSSVTERRLNATARKRTDGGSVWLDAQYSHDEDEKMFGTTGYKARTSMYTLGADIKKNDSFFGVAYSFGKGDTDTAGSDSALDTDTDYFGVNVFGETHLGPVVLNAAAGWLRQRAASETLTGGKISVHGDIWSADAGVRVPVEIEGVTISPYALAQMTALTPENTNGTEPDNIMLWQFPVGVNVTADIEALGLHWMPMIDAAVITSTGDTETTVHYAGTAYTTDFVSHTLYRGKAGLSVRSQKGEIGIMYRYTGSEDGRRSHAGLVDAKYTF